MAGELGRARALADSWRKGVAGLLLGVVGFSLIRGRSDISTLAPGFAAAAGISLATAVIAGTVAAFLILRAAHGVPDAVPVLGVLRAGRAASANAEPRTEHDEAMMTVSALRGGLIWAAVTMLGLLIAVGLTWYGPSKSSPSVVVTERSGAVWCGKVDQVTRREIALKTDSGRISLDPGETAMLSAVDECPRPR
ncbi:hypothetical protein ACGFIF_44250 [Kribbella sp. NPDC049174]|uniref:hypothetical protein n=1 Tax=Kribbella sp. NPDC049174 TaxID=3364112 RepID=UPI003713B888